MAVIAHPLAPLVALSAVTAVALCLAAGTGVATSAGSDLVLGYGWALMLLLWMDADARRLRRVPCFDFGFLAALFFPLSVAWYCWWSRRWRGVFVVLLLLALWLAPHVLAGVCLALKA
jgi:hypothetical protein